MELYQTLLSFGRTKHICQVCDRHMTDEELKPFESYVCDRPCSCGPMLNSSPQLNDKINKISPESRRRYPKDIKTWESALNDYRGLMPYESSIRRLKDIDISSLEKQILAQDGLLPSLAETAEKVCYLAPSGWAMSDVYMAGQRETGR